MPPIAGPIIVPIDQTNGITEYARAVEISNVFLRRKIQQVFKELENIKEVNTHVHALAS